MGIFKRGETYYIRFWNKGREIREAVGPLKREAEEVLAKRKAEIRAKKFGLTSVPTKPRPFADYYQHWMETYVLEHCKPATAAGYDTAYRLYLLPAFGETDIREITREQVKAVVNRMRAQDKSRAYVRSTVAPLSEMFNHALDDQILTFNPALRVLKISRKEEGEKAERVRYLTNHQLAHLLTVCREQFPRWAPFLLLLARTGLRIGEAVALQWDAVDVSRRVLDIKRSWVDGHMLIPKSNRRRTVDMSQQLTEALAGIRAVRTDTHPWVFLSHTGTMVDPDNFRTRDWAKIVTAAGLPDCTPNHLRHTFASLLLQNGASLVYVKEQMGHHSIRVTVDTYGHLVPGGNRAEVDKLDRLDAGLEVRV